MTVFVYILGFIFCNVSHSKTDLHNKYSELSLFQTHKGPTNLFEIEKITVKIKIFTNKAREVNKGLLEMY